MHTEANGENNDYQFISLGSVQAAKVMKIYIDPNRHRPTKVVEIKSAVPIISLVDVPIG